MQGCNFERDGLKACNVAMNRPLYRVVRPMMIFASIVWWYKAEKATMSLTTSTTFAKEGSSTISIQIA
jgi:hypothetical protein